MKKIMKSVFLSNKNENLDQKDKSLEIYYQNPFVI